MPNVIAFPQQTPSAAVAVRAIPAICGRPPEYALGDVAHVLGLNHFAIRTIVEKLRSLAEFDDMPLPRTPRMVNDRPLRGPLVIYSKSRWDAAEFDAWLDGRDPRGPVADAPRVLPPAINDEMRRRAASL